MGIPKDDAIRKTPRIWYRPQEYKIDWKNRKPIIKRICRLLIEGFTINRVCAREDMPSRQTFASWVMRDPEIAEDVLKAKRLAAYFNIDDINELADDATETSAGVMKARLQVDTRKWAAERLLPKIYGKAESVDVTTHKAPDMDAMASVIDKVVAKLHPPTDATQEA